MVVSKVSAYEESRLKRLEENKKRMEELNLNKLAQALSTPKASPMKRVKPKALRQPVDLSAVRRSSRVADKPPTSYKEEPIEPLGRARSYNRPYSYNRRNLANRVYASDEGRAYAIDRAEALQSGLDSKFPSFVKPMLQSHVTGGFWLGLPIHFCEKHLPTQDEYIALLDEDDNESPTKYLADKHGLSGGWRGFSIDHELVDGDALVFQLIEPTMFKVYIIRVNEVEEDDEAPAFTEVEVSTKQTKQTTASNAMKVEVSTKQTKASNVTEVEVTSKRTRESNVTEIEVSSKRTRASNVTEVEVRTKRTRASKK